MVERVQHLQFNLKGLKTINLNTHTHQIDQGSRTKCFLRVNLSKEYTKAFILPATILQVEIIIKSYRGTWVARSVKCLTSAQVMISQFCEF